ncbi:MAG: hypothetical protein JWQ72_3625 [Polaromonas sp.]|nr:hypothetical protein [Polaromonas sp.]
MKPSAIALAVASMVAAQAPQPTLEALRDHQRVLLVFGNGDNGLAETQLNIAATHAQGFRERDLTLLGLQGSTPNVPTALLSAQDDATARRRFHIAQGQFTVLLIGKDGGEKLRSNQPISWDKLQATIDSMPMRQDELRKSSAH